MRVLAQFLKWFSLHTARAAPPDAAASRPAIESLPPVIGPDDWRHVTLIDRSTAWYFDRR